MAKKRIPGTTSQPCDSLHIGHSAVIEQPSFSMETIVGFQGVALASQENQLVILWSIHTRDAAVQGVLHIC
jgi:hypothetical protein